MIPCGLLAGATAENVLTITFSADQANVNLLDEIEAIYGVLSSATVVVATVAAGVRIKSGTANEPAFRTGGFPSGSTLTLVNYGLIRGKGGAGGDGGTAATDNGKGFNGSAGGDALRLDDNISIDNTTTGQIFGGGGGGGGGAAMVVAGAPNGGGGGGGGQGDDGGSKGTALSSGDDGHNGSSSAPGAGGAGASTYGGKGGAGGAWGSAGKGGKGPSVLGGNAGNGGNAGKAISRNGKTVTWIAGYNATQVKGAVS